MKILDVEHDQESMILSRVCGRCEGAQPFLIVSPLEHATDTHPWNWWGMFHRLNGTAFVNPYSDRARIL